MATIKTSKGDIHFKQKFLFPGCHQINRQIAFQNLQLIDSILKESNIHWGVAFGTLLGIVRDNDFIEWDEDTDLYILQEEEMHFRDVLWDLIGAGFELIRYERAGLYSISRDGEYVDFYVLNKVSDEVRYTSDGGFVFERFVKERKQIDFKGIILYVPQAVEDFLSLEYGRWQVPVRYFPPKVNFVRRIGMILYCYFRLYSPDFLYFWWIKWLRTRDLRNFKVKCKKRGVYIDDNLKMSL